MGGIELCIASNSTLIVYLTPDGTKLSDVAVTDFDWLEEYMEAPPTDGNVEKYGPWHDKAQDNEAFLFHDSCWSALVKHFANGEVDLNRLFEVCKNIPGSARPVGAGEAFIPTRIIILIDAYAHRFRSRAGKGISMASSGTTYYPGDWRRHEKASQSETRKPRL
jgi:hypothetical protein